MISETISRQSTYRSLSDAQNCAPQNGGGYLKSQVVTSELNIYELERATGGCVKADWSKWWERTIDAGISNAIKRIREQEWRERHGVEEAADE